jgi:site-specific DNA-methyltransferase (adenine-specific)
MEIILREEPICKLINDDCEQYMETVPDKHFDLAIVDPPFGIGQNWRKDTHARFYKHSNDFNNSIPGEKYFNELFRVSKNQIIWGCNYYWNYLTPTNNLIFWNKRKDAIKQHGSAGELAWTSFKKYPLLEIELVWNGAVRCEDTITIHPHQKPVKLYERLLQLYAGRGNKILDTHLGSGSSAIACIRGGFEIVGVEKDPSYFEKTVKRVQFELDQYKLAI